MKKFITFAISILLIIAVFCGCSKENTNPIVDGVELATYKNITIDWESASNSQLLENALAETKITTRAIKKGDTANIDYTGYKDGIKFEGGEAKGYDLGIGSGSFIPGFEDGLIGVKPGETKNINLTFPENYQSEELAGKAVVFKVKVNHIIAETPDLNDYTDEQKSTAKENVFSDALVNHVVENSKVDKLPKKDVEAYIEKYREVYQQNATSNGYESLDAFIEAAGETKEGFEKILKTSAETQVKSEQVINAIAKKENISLKDSEYKKSLKQLASTYNTTEEEFVSTNGESYIKYVLLQDKVSEFLCKNSECK